MRERVTDVESRMRRVEEWMKEKEYERCVDELVVCRDACPLWRTPIILLLRCYVELEETEEAFQLANEECAWVENIEESEVTSELEGKDVDEELVRLVLLVFLQRNDQTSVRCLCSRMKTRDTLLWAPLKSLLAFCDACEESERRAVDLLTLRAYSEGDEAARSKPISSREERWSDSSVERTDKDVVSDGMECDVKRT